MTVNSHPEPLVLDGRFRPGSAFVIVNDELGTVLPKVFESENEAEVHIPFPESCQGKCECWGRSRLALVWVQGASRDAQWCPTCMCLTEPVAIFEYGENVVPTGPSLTYEQIAAEMSEEDEDFDL